MLRVVFGESIDCKLIPSRAFRVKECSVSVQPVHPSLRNKPELPCSSLSAVFSCFFKSSLLFHVLIDSFVLLPVLSFFLSRSSRLKFYKDGIVELVEKVEEV
jgi:hypothetical protein